MPFLAGPPAPKDEHMGTCTTCEEPARVWRFCEKVVDLTLGYSAVLSYAICRACLEMVMGAAGEDDDYGGPRAADPPG